jgi:hypothetical protein
MKKYTIPVLTAFVAAPAVALLLGSATPALGTEWGGDNENIPPGLIVSGDKGRIDNGVGNGGENIEGRTPNRNGENGGGDDDPGKSDGHSRSDKNDGRPNSPASSGIDGVDHGK